MACDQEHERLKRERHEAREALARSATAAEHDAQTIRDQAAGYNKEIATLRDALALAQLREGRLRDLARAVVGDQQATDDNDCVIVQLAAVDALMDALTTEPGPDAK